MKINRRTNFSNPRSKKPKTSAEKKFSSKLENSSIGKFVDKTLKDGKKIERSMKRIQRGADISNKELLKMQSLLYQYTQEVDLASKVVDKTAAGFKQLMNIQV